MDYWVLKYKHFRNSKEPQIGSRKPEFIKVKYRKYNKKIKDFLNYLLTRHQVILFQVYYSDWDKLWGLEKLWILNYFLGSLEVHKVSEMRIEWGVPTQWDRSFHWLGWSSWLGTQFEGLLTPLSCPSSWIEFYWGLRTLIMLCMSAWMWEQQKQKGCFRKMTSCEWVLTAVVPEVSILMKFSEMWSNISFPLLYYDFNKFESSVYHLSLVDTFLI